MESSGGTETEQRIPSDFIKEEPSDQTMAEANTEPEKQQASSAISIDNDLEESEEAECTTGENATQESDIKNTLSKCIFCDKTFAAEDNPKILECLHAACTSCINNKLSEQHTLISDGSEVLMDNAIVCQVCNVNSELGNLIENRFYCTFLEDESMDEDIPTDPEEEKKCNCSENAVATMWCVVCQEFICYNCVLAHRRLKITKDHTLKPREEITNEKNLRKSLKKHSFLICTQHPHEQLTLFCQSCDQLTCRDCQLAEHRDHKYKFIHEIAAETRTSVKNLLNEICYKRELLKSAMKVIEERQVLISEKKKTLMQEIAQMVVQLTTAINNRAKLLITRLNDVCEQKQNTLNEKKTALDELSSLTDHCIHFVNYALEKGTDSEMLYNKKSMTGHLQRIKNKRADIPNPEIPVRIHLSLEKLTDLIKVISTIGAIVVDGRVYPAGTPPIESSAPTTPLSEPPEQRQINPGAGGAAIEVAPAPPAIPILPSQAPNNVPHNAYINQAMNIPISSHQQLVQQQQMVNQQQMQTQAQNFMHYNTHNMQQRASPQNQRMSTMNVNYNGRIQPQQQQMMIPQRPGLGHQQVTSSTHPHQQQMHLVADPHQFNQNASLRGLLAQNPPAYRPTSNAVQYRFHPRYPRYSNPPRNTGAMIATVPHQNFPAGTSLLTGMQVRQTNQPMQQPIINTYQQHQQPLQQQPQQQQQQSMQSARWHIPQNAGATPPQQNYPGRNTVPIQSATSIASANDTYKITLKNQTPASVTTPAKNSSTASPPVASSEHASPNMTSVSHTVSSSMPKTPSPSPNEKSDETQKSLDKFCQKSLNDLMLTIAKLDSNGIVVIPENMQKNQTESAQVDSSTDEGINALNDNSSATSMTKDDPNEDWCAVCMDGGDAVLCCDKCPKVFHLYCHIPTLQSFPSESETWQCMLCTNVLDCSDDPIGEKRPNQMSDRDLRIAQRIVLELFCQYEQSLPFREIVSPEIVEYHNIIKNPIALEVIKKKLDPKNENHYTDLKQVMADIRLMFKNAFIFNTPDSQVYQEAKSLEEFFEKLLLKWAPTYAYDDTCVADEDEEVFPTSRKFRRIIINE